MTQPYSMCRLYMLEMGLHGNGVNMHRHGGLETATWNTLEPLTQRIRHFRLSPISGSLGSCVSRTMNVQQQGSFRGKVVHSGTETLKLFNIF